MNYRTWVCDRCGVEERSPHRKQYGCAPRGWMLASLYVHPGGAGDADNATRQWDLCPTCADVVRRVAENRPA